MDIQKFDIAVLNPAKYNPRKDLQPSDPEYIKLKNSIEKFGYVDPIIVNIRDNTNVVVGGHQRLKVLKDLGYKEVDCTVVDIDVNDEKALNIALNKISGDWDAEKLEDLLRDLTVDNYDVELTGFTLAEVETLFSGELEELDKNTNTNTNEKEKNINIVNTYELIIECIDEDDMQEKYNLLQNNNIECRINTL